MSRSVEAEDVTAFVELLHARRSDAALALALAIADDGVPTAEILTDLIGPAQVEIGERWYRDDFSIADEHAATSVADTVVTLLSAHEGRSPPTGPHVVALCPEGEWHTMPLRLAARVLELHGLEVSFLGASMPSDHLARLLTRVRPDVIMVSCSTPLAFDGVLAAVVVAHEAGLPVVGGGHAFGPDERRAHALGVDHWAPSAAEGVVLVRIATGGDLRAPSGDPRAAMALASDRPRLVRRAMEVLAERLPLLAGYDEVQLQCTRDDLENIVRFAEASILVGDGRVFDEFLSWLGPLLESRDVPLSALDMSLTVLRDLAEGPRAVLFGRDATSASC